MKKSIKAYSFFVFFLFLLSMELWLGWGGRKTFILSLFACGAFLTHKLCNIRFSFSSRNIILVLLFYIAFLYKLNGGVAQIITQIPSQLIPIICIVCVADEYKDDILNYITKWYAQLMSVSLIVYILTILLPIHGLGSLEFYPDSGYPIYENYVFYVKSANYLMSSFPRFNGPFLEPGYVGMVGAFLLYTNYFNFKKKENQIILLSVFFSLSLAGWVLLFIGYMLNVFYRGRIALAKLILYIVLVVSFIQIGQHYNNGNNIINERILSRLEYDEERGISGNNRNSDAITLLALEMWSGDVGTLLFGYDNKYFLQFEDWELIGSGFDKFLVHHGLLCVLLVLSFYFYTICTARDKKFALLFFVFVAFCFWQRCYAQWFSWIICFYYSSVIADRNKCKKTPCYD